MLAPAHCMQSGLGPKQIVITFLVVLALYLAAYHGIEYRRHMHGPWSAEFSVDAQDRPAVAITQLSLGISNLTLHFPGETVPTNLLPARVSFAKPKNTVPFGEVIYEDLTFLPGVVTFNLFGHEIEILPRVLTINKREIPWTAVGSIDVDPTTKPQVPPRPPSR